MTCCVSGIQLIILSFLCHELVMISALNDAPLFENNDAVTVLDRREAVCNDERRSALHQDYRR